ncbi:helix-turn-helix domain-containing protein [Vibrio breoganii]
MTRFCEIAGKLRIKAAKELLTSTELSITDVSTEVGYTDQSNFWRAFVKGTGLNPSEFRQMTSTHDKQTTAV